MDAKDIRNIHNKVLEIYKDFLLPVVNKYFGNEENPYQEKYSKEYSTTLVTQADLEMNNILSKKLAELLPGSSVISEESDVDIIGEYTFIIDPIDGTHTFIRNLDDWGICIVLCEKGVVIYSVIFYPNCKTEYYYAIKGEGAFDPTKKIALHPLFKFKPAFVVAPGFRKIGRALIDFTKGKQLSFHNYGSCVYAGYALFRGGADFIVFDHLNVWDVLGCVFIAEQAGFKTIWFGEKPNLENKAKITSTKYTPMIYKPDFDQVLLDDILKTIRSAM